MPGGRPSTFKPEYVGVAYKLALAGYPDTRIAAHFGLKQTNQSGDPLNRWRRRFPEFDAVMTRGREVARGEVAASLHERAIGYSHQAVKIFPPRKAGDEPVIVPYVEHYPPDTNAAMFILTNREPDLWSNRTEVVHDISDRVADRLEAARLRMLGQLDEPKVIEHNPDEPHLPK